MKKFLLALALPIVATTLVAAPADARPNPHIPFAECSNAGHSLASHEVVPCVWNGTHPFVIRKSGINDISHRRAESGWGCGGAC
jgi:hypothetical protein